MSGVGTQGSLCVLRDGVAERNWGGGGGGGGTWRWWEGGGTMSGIVEFATDFPEMKPHPPS